MRIQFFNAPKSAHSIFQSAKIGACLRAGGGLIKTCAAHIKFFLSILNTLGQSWGGVDSEIPHVMNPVHEGFMFSQLYCPLLSMSYLGIQDRDAIDAARAMAAADIEWGAQDYSLFLR